MCYGCWQDYGAPTIYNDKVKAAQPLIAAVYDYSCAGGNLHIVVDDFNIEDHSLDFCQGQIDRGGHPEDPLHAPWYTASKLADPDSPEQLAAEQACLTAFKAMTLEERAAALGLYGECWRAAV